MTTTERETCDLCGFPIAPDRNAMDLGVEPLIIGGQRVKVAHLGCYRLNREILSRGLDPRDYA